ncbi:hypothetical protein KY285_025968 [Solanum tuberosum]|nr:hypothetical protein KY285_025959 [Solanum tuberosum]KAH0664762.1 hypothetical protein KY285_025968 [Solanum tuberosum]
MRKYMFTSVCLGRVSASIFNNGERYFGEQLRGSLYNNHWVNQLLRSLKPEKEESKIKPEVAFSVIAIQNDKETLSGKYFSPPIVIAIHKLCQNQRKEIGFNLESINWLGSLTITSSCYPKIFCKENFLLEGIT